MLGEATLDVSGTFLGEAIRLLILFAAQHRPFSTSELKRREQLLVYMEAVSEDELIQEVLLPLFRQIQFMKSQ